MRLRWVRAGEPCAGSRAGDPPSPGHGQAGTASPGVINEGERARLLAQARVPSLVAAQISQLMRDDLGKREGLRCELMRCQRDDELAAAWLCLRVEELDRLIIQQVSAVDRHLRESRRLRQLADLP
ncbi:MAG: hypothetical protein ACR2MP_14415 [Streptosporangiaceae bacterium]